ncbi:MAG: hypothetical protein ACLUD0_20720 [Eubacterium ramulus]
MTKQSGEHSTVVVEFYSATCKHCKKLEAGHHRTFRGSRK